MVIGITITAAPFATPVPPVADALMTEIGTLDVKVFAACDRCHWPTCIRSVSVSILCDAVDPGHSIDESR